MTPPELNLDRCRDRQRRLCESLAEWPADIALLVTPEHVQYLTGFRPHRLMTAMVALTADGHCTLVAPNAPPQRAAADDVVTFPAQWHATLRQEQCDAAAAALNAAFAGNPKPARAAVEFSHCGPVVLNALNWAGVELVDAEPVLWRQRRRKDDDELDMIRHAIASTDAMYARARAVIEPGISELEVFNQLHAAAVNVAGEPLTALGNDFQCNSPGGPPRSRRAEAGELFILDLGPAYRGFYADNCRTFSVDRQPTDPQRRAWESVVATLEMVEQSVKPGLRCRELFDRAQTMLDEFRPGAFSHHLGHGIGLFPHETPHLNLNWDDTFEEGDVFTAEPGLYAPELRAGIRLEQNYRVTADGVERLTTFPLEL